MKPLTKIKNPVNTITQLFILTCIIIIILAYDSAFIEAELKRQERLKI